MASHGSDSASGFARASRVLVVDDLETNRFLLEEALEGVADEIVAAAGGAEALQAVERLEPEVVVLDLQMPGLDGIETSCRIKQRMPSTYVLLLSGAPAAESAADLRRARADRYLEKPVPLERLRDAVREGLRIGAERRRRGESAPPRQ